MQLVAGADQRLPFEQFPDEKSMQVSPETIYRSLYIQARGVLKKDLIKHLRTGRRMRRAKAASARVILAHGADPGCDTHQPAPGADEDRAVPGHWEGDLLVGWKHSKIATLVERRSRFVMLVRCAAVTGDGGRCAERAVLQTARGSARLADVGSRHRDGRANASPSRPSAGLLLRSPQSVARGSNENTNGLLRQYFPKGTDLSGYTRQPEQGCTRAQPTSFARPSVPNSRR